MDADADSSGCDRHCAQGGAVRLCGCRPAGQGELSHLALPERQHFDAGPIKPAKQNKNMNAELVKKALEKILNPNVLVNLVSQRVRQLTHGGGGVSRPLILDAGNLGAADIALREIIEDKITFEMPEIIELTRPT